ncbi:MAG: mandelate racemase/muconate lactonizing enzyme family protein [Ectothiorhodospiraceae bacterium]|nr:mandelate racemase/muconate lactonizing enzyme family protein [Chromatiales bacterium]MCP5153543.1 mandelate racemase/muconate lactonizing enzyme family protein [Ectothiorhodospiraceae bacterium]
MRPGLNTRPWMAMDCLMVRVETADGRSGWGEAFAHFVGPATQAILDRLLGPWFIGRDAGAITRLMEQAQHAFHGLGRNGPVLHALSGIDIALWDLAAQRAGQPLFRLLGGDGAPLERYASLMRYGGDVDAVARNCRRAVDCGYRVIKLHETTVPAFRAARDAVEGRAGIALDVNCPWSVDEARAIAREIRDDHFYWLEEPVWPPEDFRGIARVRDEGVTVAAGENVGTAHEFQRLFEAGAVDVAQPSVTKVGGISAMRRILEVARVYPVRVVPHCFYWGPGYLATAHVAASTPRPTLVETAFIDLERPPHPCFEPASASLTLPDQPGLGFLPDWDALEPHVVARGMTPSG